jgi:hypothetical protein
MPSKLGRELEHRPEVHPAHRQRPNTTAARLKALSFLKGELGITRRGQHEYPKPPKTAVRDKHNHH